MILGNVVLPRRASVINRLRKQILGHVDPAFGKSHILKLDKKPLSFTRQNLKVFADKAEVVAVFFRLELTPRICNLGTFKLFIVEKGRRSSYLLPVLGKEN